MQSRVQAASQRSTSRASQIKDLGLRFGASNVW